MNCKRRVLWEQSVNTAIRTWRRLTVAQKRMLSSLMEQSILSALTTIIVLMGDVTTAELYMAKLIILVVTWNGVLGAMDN